TIRWPAICSAPPTPKEGRIWRMRIRSEMEFIRGDSYRRAQRNACVAAAARVTAPPGTKTIPRRDGRAEAPAAPGQNRPGTRRTAIGSPPRERLVRWDCADCCNESQTREWCRLAGEPATSRRRLSASTLDSELT